MMQSCKYETAPMFFTNQFYEALLWIIFHWIMVLRPRPPMSWSMQTLTKTLMLARPRWLIHKITSVKRQKQEYKYLFCYLGRWSKLIFHQCLPTEALPCLFGKCARLLTGHPWALRNLYCRAFSSTSMHFNEIAKHIQQLNIVNCLKTLLILTPSTLFLCN